jgi:predicted DNA-binding transcriptional regulator YafY
VVEARTRTVEHLDVEGLVHAMAALRTHAVLLEPPEAVAALRAHLQAIVDLDVDAAPDLGPSADPPRPTPATAAGITTATPPSRVGGGRLTAARRWRVITTALALGEGRDGAVTIEEIARLTDTTSAQARAALEQYAGCSVVHDGEDDFVHPGLTITGPGTGPDGGTVSVTAPWLLGQWQPTPAHALRLLVAATAALALSAATRPTDPGRADPDARLRTAQQKLARYLAVTLGHRDGGAGELHRLIAVAAPSAPPIVREIAAVIARGRTVVVVTGDGMGTLGERTTELDPVQVRFVTDRWVLEGRVRWRDPAPDHGDDGSPAPAGSAEIVRMPIDVIRRVEEGPDDADPDPPDAPAEPVDAPVVVTLDLDPGALWMLDPYPVHALDRTGDGRVRITATIPDAVELRTLLLCIGAQGRLREPAALRRRPAEIARAMLDRHSA